MCSCLTNQSRHEWVWIFKMFTPYILSVSVLLSTYILLRSGVWGLLLFFYLCLSPVVCLCGMWMKGKDQIQIKKYMNTVKGPFLPLTLSLTHSHSLSLLLLFWLWLWCGSVRQRSGGVSPVTPCRAPSRPPPLSTPGFRVQPFGQRQVVYTGGRCEGVTAWNCSTVQPSWNFIYLLFFFFTSLRVREIEGYVVSFNFTLYYDMEW